MRIITTGSRYVDIDAYGGCVAYAELLNLQGVPAVAASTVELNGSVPPVVRAWQAPFEFSYRPVAGDTFAVLDVSEPDFFDKMITLDHIEEVIDHHPGYETYWQERLGDKADIELAGAVCTMIYERWAGAGLITQISEVSARLLMCGILDNTLNFGAQITTNRDHTAYAELAKRASLPDDWSAQYFEACEAGVLSDLASAIRDDSKLVTFAGQAQAIGVGQLIIWDARTFVSNNKQTIEKVMPSIASPWFMSIPSISEGKNYLLCPDAGLRTWLSELLDATFDGDVGVTKRLWLRKEIIKAAIDKEAGDVSRKR
ncbi:MAG TPA: DHH family protein [Bacillota bacterium]|nr:DHH family protein [Bacillota bacterium]